MKVEFSDRSEADFELIFDHLFESYRHFGESTGSAFDHTARRVREIRRAAERIATAPHRGERHDRILPGLRHLTMDHAIYWFVVDDADNTIRVLGVFFGGQDHIRHMLRRILMSSG